MTWLIVLGVSLFVVAGLAYPTWRDFTRMRRIGSLAEQGDHRGVLAAPLPRGPARQIANLVKGESAVLSGRYQEALDIMEGIADIREVRQIRASTEDPDIYRLVALVGLGRYAEAARELGDDPADPLRRHVRAQIAIEMGNDDAAEALLAHPDDEPMSEAGRLRILGDLRIRRGRFEEGRDLVTRARNEYEGLDTAGVAVDRAYCNIHLAEAALAEGDDQEASSLAEAAATLLRDFPHHAFGLSFLRSVAAEIAAARQEADEAEAHVAAALELAELCCSPPLIARGHQAAAVVARSRGDEPAAFAACRRSLEILDEIGARPAASRLREALGSPERPAGE